MIEVTLRQIKSWIDCDIDDQFLDVKIKGVQLTHVRFNRKCYLFLLKESM